MYAAALQQVIGEDPVQSRLQAVLAPALAPVLQYVARTPAHSATRIASVAGVNSTLVPHPSAKAQHYLVPQSSAEAHHKLMMALHDTRHHLFSPQPLITALGRAHG